MTENDRRIENRTSKKNGIIQKKTSPSRSKEKKLVPTPLLMAIENWEYFESCLDGCSILQRQ